MNLCVHLCAYTFICIYVCTEVLYIACVLEFAKVMKLYYVHYVVSQFTK